MAISGAVLMAMQYAPDAYGSVKSYMNPRLAVKPSVRAEYVDAVNRVLPEGRKDWDQQQMFLFLSAFTRMTPHRSNAVEWWRDKNEIVSFVVRGLAMSAEERQSVTQSILGAMAEVEKTLVLVPGLSTAVAQELSLNETTGNSAIAVPTNPYARIGGTLRKAWTTTAGVIAKPYVSAKSIRERNGRVNLLRGIANSLEQGGLSTIEVRDILLEQGLAVALVDAALLNRPEE